MTNAPVTLCEYTDFQRPYCAHGARVAADLKEAQAFRFDGVPAFVINHTVIEGAQAARLFFEVIDGKLRR